MSHVCTFWTFLFCMTWVYESSLCVSNMLVKDSSCGIRRGCFHDCTEMGCSFLITWSQRPATNVVDMSMNFQLNEYYMYESRWHAVGFSSDQDMGDDSVIECNIDYTFYWLADVLHSYNKDCDNVPVLQSRLGLSEVIGRVENNILTCNFTRDLTIVGEPQIFQLDTPWYMLVASGPMNYGRKQRHEKGPSLSPMKIDMRTIVDVKSQESDILLIKLHACFMIFAWVIVTSISIVIARYYKNVWTHSDTRTRKKMWFQVHRVLMVVCVLVVMAAFVMIWVHLRGFAKLNEAPFYQKAHPILGIIIMGFTIINPIIAILRPKSGTLSRPVFRWAHTFVGTVVYILAVLNIIIGVTLRRSPAPPYMIWILVGFAVYQLLFEVFLEMFECHVVKSGKFSDYVMKDLATSTTGSEMSVSNNPPGALFKKIVLVIHSMIILGLGSCLIVLIVIE